MQNPPSVYTAHTQTPERAASETMTHLAAAGLYKVAQQRGLPLPEPPFLIYLAGVVAALRNPEFRTIHDDHIASDEDDLIAKVRAGQQMFPSTPHTRPRLIGQTSGDFHLAVNAMFGKTNDWEFPAQCYSIAQANAGYRNDMATLHGLMALRSDQYLLLLANYYAALAEKKEQPFLTPEDIETFRQDFLRSLDPDIALTVNQLFAVHTGAPIDQVISAPNSGLPDLGISPEALQEILNHNFN